MTQLTFILAEAWTVTELTRFIRSIIIQEDQLQDIWVRGEISNIIRHSSGHVYFTLKDNFSTIKCVMWKSTAQKQDHLPVNGEAVEVHGKIDVFETAGQYQLYADEFRSLGEGFLFQEFMRIKNKLEAEGLFDQGRKRMIPVWPEKIGIVTSPTGAALQDILNTIKRRFPLGYVFIAPTLVQGDEAPLRIIAAIETLNKTYRPDVIILARGGGSIEDLWSFNDERVARAIVDSATPIICGVGHETDFTIADFASDLRAPTPTAAAELATPNLEDIKINVINLDDRLKRAMEIITSKTDVKLSNISKRLKYQSPLSRVSSNKQRLDEFSFRIGKILLNSVRLERTRLSGITKQLESISPLAILDRGFAIVTRQNGEIITRVEQTFPGDQIIIRVSDGSFPAEVKKE